MIEKNNLKKNHFSAKGTYLEVDFSKFYFPSHNFFANNRLDPELKTTLSYYIFSRSDRIISKLTIALASSSHSKKFYKRILALVFPNCSSS